ncbi:MAG: prepilin-type N-terminal cleavage/methylation domain-containing protein [Candidatus Omnitrophica bacterium]|nr:MAG: Type II secretion system protein G precursor [Candidatus Hinthialibacteria bacterium OLB16]MCL4734829.1 prepilin-type N-terminal cleavage/methylation domain-containing protein [Candidatus Omnitrophota bacterium]NUP94297.1 prepilin-type N-terminal cleavage/methylation domain-containing protein [Candidatus Omnitrophota bacterium]
MKSHDARPNPGAPKGCSKGFTLIELLIVIAIILILISIALPNFLAAQIRAKVARAEADMKSMTTALEFFRTEHSHYPVGTDSPEAVPIEVKEHFQQGGSYGFYTFRTVFSGKGAESLGFPSVPSGTPVGVVPGLTTPVAYIHSVPTDPFTSLPGFLTYSYREDRSKPLVGWVVSSFGPDMDEFENTGKSGTGAGCRTPLLPALDAQVGGRHGDINERAAHPGSDATGMVGGEPSRSFLAEQMKFLAYSPTNGITSDGDIFTIGP